MKLILALLCLLIAPVSRADEPLSFPTLTTTQGVIYHEVKVTKFDALQVKFIHRNGVATVPLAELPANVQKIFGYDPVNASFEMILKQEERRKHIIEDADKKAKHAALIEQERLDTEELQSIRDHVLRCCVQDISETESGPLIYVLPVAKLPIKLKSRSGKYERVKLTPLGKPELVEQIVAGQEFSLGPTIRLLPAPTFLARSTMISVYLVEAEPGSPAICSVTPEDALKYRRKIAQYKEQQKEAEKKAQTKP
jgi:hypothetical protein